MPSINFITTLWLSPIVGLLFKERVSYKPCGLYEDPVSLFFFFFPSVVFSHSIKLIAIQNNFLHFALLLFISYLLSHIAFTHNIHYCMGTF